MTEELSDYNLVHSVMCFWVETGKDEMEAFEALDRMNETVQQLRDGLSELEAMVELGQGRLAVQTKIKALQEQG